MITPNTPYKVDVDPALREMSGVLARLRNESDASITDTAAAVVLQAGLDDIDLELQQKRAVDATQEHQDVLDALTEAMDPLYVSRTSISSAQTWHQRGVGTRYAIRVHPSVELDTVDKVDAYKAIRDLRASVLWIPRAVDNYLDMQRVGLLTGETLPAEQRMGNSEIRIEPDVIDVPHVLIGDKVIEDSVEILCMPLATGIEVDTTAFEKYSEHILPGYLDRTTNHIYEDLHFDVQPTRTGPVRITMHPEDHEALIALQNRAAGEIQNTEWLESVYADVVSSIGVSGKTTNMAHIVENPKDMTTMRGRLAEKRYRKKAPRNTIGDLFMHPIHYTGIRQEPLTYSDIEEYAVPLMIARTIGLQGRASFYQCS